MIADTLDTCGQLFPIRPMAHAHKGNTENASSSVRSVRNVEIQPIDRSVGQSNGKFLGHVANGMTRAELERRWKAGEFPGLNATIAQNAMKEAGR